MKKADKKKIGKPKRKAMGRRHKKKLRLRLVSFVLFLAGMLAAFGALNSALGIILASAIFIVAVLGSFLVCAYSHTGAKVAAVLGILGLELPIFLENMGQWHLFAALGLAAAYYVWKHD